MTTLRSRVLTVATLGLALTIAALTAVTAWLSYQRSLTVLDEDLRRQLVHILTEAAQRPVAQVLADEPPASRVTTFLVTGDGRIVAASPGPEDVATAAQTADLRTVTGVTPTNVEADDTRLRAVAQQVADQQWVVVAGEYDEVRAQAWRFAGLVGLTGLGCLLAGALGTSIALSRAVRPVQDLADATARLEPDDLRPVPVPAGPREVTELADELNTLLTRVREEETRRNRFLATLSHEMRTPLTVARSQLEALSLYGPAPGDDGRDVATVANNEIVRASAMLDAFLTLARSQEPGYVALADEYLPDLVGELRVRLSAMPQVDVAEASAATVPLDRERIAQAVLNCVTNALRGADQVEIHLEHTPTWLDILIDDDGPGWPADREALLEPFASNSGSTGLGLAVVNSIATAHSGSVALEDSPLGGARTRIRLPAREPAST